MDAIFRSNFPWTYFLMTCSTSAAFWPKQRCSATPVFRDPHFLWTEVYYILCVLSGWGYLSNHDQCQTPVQHQPKAEGPTRKSKPYGNTTQEKKWRNMEHLGIPNCGNAGPHRSHTAIFRGRSWGQIALSTLHLLMSSPHIYIYIPVSNYQGNFTTAY